MTSSVSTTPLEVGLVEVADSIPLISSIHSLAGLVLADSAVSLVAMMMNLVDNVVHPFVFVSRLVWLMWLLALRSISK